MKEAEGMSGAPAELMSTTSRPLAKALVLYYPVVEQRLDGSLKQHEALALQASQELKDLEPELVERGAQMQNQDQEEQIDGVDKAQAASDADDAVGECGGVCWANRCVREHTHTHARTHALTHKHAHARAQRSPILGKAGAKIRARKSGT